MPIAPKPPLAKTSAVARTKPKTAPAATTGAAVKSAAKPAEKAAVVTAAVAPRARKLTPATPEPITPATTRRKKLSKAFSRPLDKKPAKTKLVRDRFTIPEAEYEQLVKMKKRLAALGITIKKSELVRAGLLQLASMDDAKLQAATAKLPVT